MYKNTQKYTNTCTTQSNIPISISEKNQAEPTAQTQSHSWKQ